MEGIGLTACLELRESLGYLDERPRGLADCLPLSYGLVAPCLGGHEFVIFLGLRQRCEFVEPGLRLPRGIGGALRVC